MNVIIEKSQMPFWMSEFENTGEEKVKLANDTFKTQCYHHEIYICESHRKVLYLCTFEKSNGSI